MFDQIFFQLVFWFISKMTILSIFHPLRIFWRLKLRGQSIRFCTASYLHGTPMRNLHFCVLFVHCYLFPKWYHCTSFIVDLLFVFFLLCFWGFTVSDFQQIYYFHFSELNHVSRPIVNWCKISPPYNLVINLNLRCLTKFTTFNKFTIDNWYLTYHWQSSLSEKHCIDRSKSHRSHLSDPLNSHPCKGKTLSSRSPSTHTSKVFLHQDGTLSIPAAVDGTRKVLSFGECCSCRAGCFR